MISMIVACDINGGIGYKGDLLFHISEDLKRFKELTTEHTIIMGRKTFESLPKVLPNREHIVITRNIYYKHDSKAVRILYNLNEAIIKLFKDLDEEVFVIGGGEIYKRFLPYCDRIYLTQIFEEKEADTYFNVRGLEDFIVESCTPCKTNSSKHDILFFNLIRDTNS